MTVDLQPWDFNSVFGHSPRFLDHKTVFYSYSLWVSNKLLALKPLPAI